jgi:hypothetical protein
MLYACLPNKEKITYTKLWTLLKPVIKTTPKSITHDFEQAAIGEVKATWKEEFKLKELVISDCYFHYDQCLWRQIQAKELSIQYKNDLVCLIIVAFIPLNDVFFAFDIISNIRQYILSHFSNILNSLGLRKKILHINNPIVERKVFFQSKCGLFMIVF